MSTDIKTDIRRRAIHALRVDAEKIHTLIRVQLAHLTGPKCPLYEEVVDTQMFGMSREVEFAVRVGLVTKEEASEIMDQLEVDVTKLHEAISTLSSFKK